MAKVRVTCSDCQHEFSIKLLLSGANFACPRCSRKWNRQEVNALLEEHRNELLDERAKELEGVKHPAASRVKELHDSGQVHQDILTQLDAIRTHLEEIRLNVWRIFVLLILPLLLFLVFGLLSRI